MRYILALLGIIVVIIAAVLLIFNRGPSPDSQQGERRVTITDYIDKPSTAVYTVEGELNAEEDHRAIRISVSRNMRTIEVLSGYNKTVINTQSFPNTQAAYDEFIHGLEKAGFNRQQEPEFKEENGVCPLGSRFAYQLREDNDDVLRLWSTSCGRNDGTMGGNATLIRQLFQKQIPGYTTIVRGVKL